MDAQWPDISPVQAFYRWKNTLHGFERTETGFKVARVATNVNADNLVLYVRRRSGAATARLTTDVLHIDAVDWKRIPGIIAALLAALRTGTDGVECIPSFYTNAKICTPYIVLCTRLEPRYSVARPPGEPDFVFSPTQSERFAAIHVAGVAAARPHYPEELCATRELYLRAKPVLAAPANADHALSTELLGLNAEIEFPCGEFTRWCEVCLVKRAAGVRCDDHHGI